MVAINPKNTAENNFRIILVLRTANKRGTELASLWTIKNSAA